MPVKVALAVSKMKMTSNRKKTHFVRYEMYFIGSAIKKESFLTPSCELHFGEDSSVNDALEKWPGLTYDDSMSILYNVMDSLLQ